MFGKYYITLYTFDGQKMDFQAPLLDTIDSALVLWEKVGSLAVNVSHFTITDRETGVIVYKGDYVTDEC